MILPEMYKKEHMMHGQMSICFYNFQATVLWQSKFEKAIDLCIYLAILILRNIYYFFAIIAGKLQTMGIKSKNVIIFLNMIYNFILIVRSIVIVRMSR